MALDTRTPGVYVQEVSIFPPSVTSVATAIPAFIGYTNKAAGTIARISSMNDYVDNFGGPHKYVVVNVTNPVAATVSFASKNFILYYVMQMYFANGGGPCYVISTGNYPSAPSADDFATAWNTGAAFAKLILEDEPTLIVMPELQLFAADKAYGVYVHALAQCERLQDRFVIMDVNLNPVSPATNVITELRDRIGTQNLKYGAAYYPDLVTSLAYPASAVTFTGNGDLGTTATMAEVIASTNATVAAAWLSVEKAVRKALDAQTITLPPSGAIAGVYAATDRSRGVWKAPANVSLSGVLKPTVTITHDDQQDLNVPTNGKAVNAIRSFTGKGTLVWGARTLAGNDNEWRYVPVRRLFIMIEESVRKATEFVVFEPNDANTWLKVKTMIENYLTNLWKDGALAGAVPKDAFFVKVGLNQTMTAQDILEGKLIVEMGLAAVRPAEFVILKFSHKLQES
jgi:uncharacterized protein